MRLPENDGKHNGFMGGNVQVSKERDEGKRMRWTRALDGANMGGTTAQRSWMGVYGVPLHENIAAIIFKHSAEVTNDLNQFGPDMYVV